MRSLLALIVLALPACTVAEARPSRTPGQCYADALAVMCDVDHLAGLDADADPIAVGQKRSAWIEGHAENPDSIELRVLMSVKGASEQAEMLRAQAKQAGIARCALADSLEKSGAGGLSP
jgi:hypothetical protein